MVRFRVGFKEEILIVKQTLFSGLFKISGILIKNVLSGYFSNRDMLTAPNNPHSPLKQIQFNSPTWQVGTSMKPLRKVPRGLLSEDCGKEQNRKTDVWTNIIIVISELTRLFNTFRTKTDIKLLPKEQHVI